MAKIDNNGVRHDGWAAVGEANRQRSGCAGSADRDYEQKAKSQGVDLSRTGYRKTSGYSYGRVSISSPGNDDYDLFNE